MKLIDEFVITKLSDEYVAVPLNRTEGFQGVVKLNESGAEVFRGLIDGQNEEQIVQRLQAKYPELDTEMAKKAVTQVLDSLKKTGILKV